MLDQFFALLGREHQFDALRGALLEVARKNPMIMILRDGGLDGHRQMEFRVGNTRHTLAESEGEIILG
ncbi:MAG: hypothetical protein EXS48_02995 [Candidatus Staskawiczbacteria bacterium]|nr:hypothetical protein [Candidatus Staskawiczbacteria bacterium]